MSIHRDLTSGQQEVAILCPEMGLAADKHVCWSAQYQRDGLLAPMELESALVGLLASKGRQRKQREEATDVWTKKICFNLIF